MTAPGADARHGTPQDGERLDGVLDEFVGKVAGMRHALILSADGLARGASRALSREDSEQLAAVASGFHSLARGVGTHFNTGGVRQTLVELDDAFLFVAAAGQGSALAVFADIEADIGQIGYEMTLLIKRVGAQLGIAARGGSAGES